MDQGPVSCVCRARVLQETVGFIAPKATITPAKTVFIGFDPQSGKLPFVGKRLGRCRAGFVSDQFP